MEPWLRIEEFSRARNYSSVMVLHILLVQCCNVSVWFLSANLNSPYHCTLQKKGADNVHNPNRPVNVKQASDFNQFLSFNSIYTMIIHMDTELLHICSLILKKRWALAFWWTCRSMFSQTTSGLPRAFLFSSASPPTGVWWRWTTTALGSTTAAATLTTATSPASCCWLLWAARTLPSSLLWPCTRSFMRGWVVFLPHYTVLLKAYHHHSFSQAKVKQFIFPNWYRNCHTHQDLFFVLTADFIWLEHCEDWHECRASVPAPHALQRSCLCCHTLCLRLGTGYHYCGRHAFLHTGKVCIRGF